MSKKKTAFAYIRLELPDTEKLIPELLQPLEAYAEKHHIEISKTYHDVPGQHKQYVHMMMDAKARKFDFDFILISSLHHLTNADILGIFRQLDVPVSKGLAVVSVEDNFTINQDNINQFKKIFRIFETNAKRLKTEKINHGIFKKHQRILSGEEAPPSKRGGNYRKTDRDDSVAELRNKGFTLKEIAAQEKMSIGRVRAILAAVKEKTYEELDNPQNLLDESKGEDIS
jgi:DNA invertase Pin-like site-specific DNA recombinase